MAGIEPATFAVSRQRSTAELHASGVDDGIRTRDLQCHKPVPVQLGLIHHATAQAARFCGIGCLAFFARNETPPSLLLISSASAVLNVGSRRSPRSTRSTRSASSPVVVDGMPVFRNFTQDARAASPVPLRCPMFSGGPVPISVVLATPEFTFIDFFHQAIPRQVPKPTGNVELFGCRIYMVELQPTGGSADDAGPPEPCQCRFLHRESQGAHVVSVEFAFGFVTHNETVPHFRRSCLLLSYGH